MNWEILCGLLALVCLCLIWKNYSLKVRLLIAEERAKQIKQSQEELRSNFRSLSHEALEANNRIFLDLALSNLEKFQDQAAEELKQRQSSIEELVKPVKEKLSSLDQGLQALEKERKGDHISLKTQISLLVELERKLMQETSSLSKALRAPQTRGRWGEIQLRRVVEICGMVNHCDFLEQVTGEENKIRPDLIVKLPGGRQILIDAKAQMDAYLNSLEIGNEEQRLSYLIEHARSVRTHAQALGKKSYHQYFQPTPEFVVLFLPSENFFSAALEQDPLLIEIGIEQGVVIATPTTLIGLLKAIAYGWKQENLNKHIEEVSKLGHDLYKRLGDMTTHFSRTGKALYNAVESYNQTIRSLETRVLVSARKFKEMGAGSQEIDLPILEPIEKVPLSKE